MTGLTRDQGDSILATVSEVAGTAGAPLAGEHCSPDLFIFVTSEPQKLIHDIQERNSASVSGAAPTESVHEFIDTHGPVNVWYNMTTETFGVPSPLVGQYVRVTAPFISQVFVIVDSARMEGVSLAQLAGYVAMVGLADLKPSLRGDTQSILTLFDGPSNAALSGMTDWDRALLKSLYSAELPGQQREQLASDMAQIVPDPVEDIVITAHREKLSELERQLDKSEDAFYEAYNKINTESEFNMSCVVVHPPMHECTPQFVLTARWNSVGMAAPGLAMAMRIAVKTPIYRKHMLDVIEKHPELIKMLEDYNTLVRHYQAVRQEKFKGKFIVWD